MLFRLENSLTRTLFFMDELSETFFFFIVLECKCSLLVKLLNNLAIFFSLCIKDMWLLHCWYSLSWNNTSVHCSLYALCLYNCQRIKKMFSLSATIYQHKRFCCQPSALIRKSMTMQYGTSNWKTQIVFLFIS